MITNISIGYNGRLGNQIFQFAALFGVAKKLGYDLVIPQNNTNPVLSYTMDGKSHNARFELADCFEIEKRYIGNPEGIRYMARERHFHFDSEIFTIPDFCAIDGYFQSGKYFEHCKEELLNQLSFKNHIKDRALQILPNTNKLVSIHVRRGDYLHPNPHHPLQDLTYYDSAISKFDEEHTFVVFSDDTQWCRDTWGDRENFFIFDSESQFVDLCAMSLCQHNIISNSSFSWWGSYLNRNHLKKIYAPAKWFGPGYANYKLDDLYTDDMILL